MSKSPTTVCYLKELAYTFPNPKDLTIDNKLFDSNKYTIPSKSTCDVVNKGVLKETCLTDAKETENSRLYEVFILEVVEKLKSGSTW